MIVILIASLIGAAMAARIGNVGEALPIMWIAMLMGSVFALLTGALYHGHTVREPHRLESLADRMTVHGTFFLFGGTIDGQAEYAWYEEVAPNTFQQKHTDASISSIHYTRGTPHYVVTKHIGDGGLKPWGISVDSTYETRYDFYVPPGSITNAYKLDAQ